MFSVLLFVYSYSHSTTGRKEHSKATKERPGVHKAQNPMAQKLGPETHEAKGARETERGSRAAEDIGEVAISRAIGPKSTHEQLLKLKGKRIR